MTVQTLHLVWKRNGEDIELGECYLAGRPLVGDLITYSSNWAPDQSGVWRIVLVYHHPFEHGSQTWRNWRDRGEQPEATTYYWVEPADGPWEP